MKIHYFASIAASVGVNEEVMVLERPTSLADIVTRIGESHPKSASENVRAAAFLLPTCSFLRNTVVVKDHNTLIEDTDSLDVLPRFAGG